MKKIIIAVLLLNISMQLFAQSPPKIRVPKSEAEKKKEATEKLFATQGVFKPGTSFTKGLKYYSADNR